MKEGNSVTFDASLSNDNNDIQFYEWDFDGDGVFEKHDYDGDGVKE